MTMTGSDVMFYIEAFTQLLGRSNSKLRAFGYWAVMPEMILIAKNVSSITKPPKMYK